jgi:DNA-binding transcriptional MerR regulator
MVLAFIAKNHSRHLRYGSIKTVIRLASLAFGTLGCVGYREVEHTSVTYFYKEGAHMRMEKRTFRIGELAKLLDVKRFVIRFWEKEFDLSSTRSEGGQRFYTTTDLNTFKSIKELLYYKGYTIAGARKALFKQTKEAVSQTPLLASKKTSLPENTPSPATLDVKDVQIKELQDKLYLLQQQLHRLYNLL